MIRLGIGRPRRTRLDDPSWYRQASENARRYYLRTHTVEVVMPQFRQAVERVLAEEGPK